MSHETLPNDKKQEQFSLGPAVAKQDIDVAPQYAEVEEFHCNHPRHHHGEEDADPVDTTEKIVKIIKSIDEKPKEAQVVEAHVELEKTKLQVWLIKAAVFFLAAFATLLLSGVIYATSTSTDIIVPTFVAEAFGSFKDVFMAIVELK